VEQSAHSLSFFQNLKEQRICHQNKVTEWGVILIMEAKSFESFRRSWLIVIFSLALGFFFDFLIFDKIPGLGLALFIGLIAGFFVFLAIYLKRPIKADVMWLIPLLLFFAAMVAVRANPLLIALNILGCMLLLLLIAEVSVRGSVRQFVPVDYLKVLLSPFLFIKPLLQTGSDVLSVRTRYGDQKKLTQILRGIVITLPVVIIFGFLFASADPVFNKYATGLVSFNLEEETIARLILILVVTVVLTGAYGYSFTGSPFSWGRQDNGRRPIGQLETSILLGSVNVLFLGFILIQIAYLFGGESYITAQGFTYAEYARRGFFELIAIAILSYLILFGVEKFVERDGDHPRAFKILSSVLVLQVVIIMASAFYRLSLYEQAFGFTTLRLYSHAFIIFLAVVFSFLLYKILIENKDNTFAFRTFLAIVVFLGVMNVFNPDAFIARKNLERFNSTGKIDTPYLLTLSADATPVSIVALDIPDENIKKEAEIHFLNRLQNNLSREQKWQSWNLSRARENSLIKERELK